MIFLFAVTLSSFACEIEFNIQDNAKKDFYKAGDVVIIELNVINTHRDCHENIADAKIMADGCKIAGATPWKEIKRGTFTRKLKVIVLPDGDHEFQVACKRSCQKDGGFGKIALQKKA